MQVYFWGVVYSFDEHPCEVWKLGKRRDFYKIWSPFKLLSNEWDKVKSVKVTPIMSDLFHTDHEI